MLSAKTALTKSMTGASSASSRRRAASEVKVPLMPRPSRSRSSIAVAIRLRGDRRQMIGRSATCSNTPRRVRFRGSTAAQMMQSSTGLWVPSASSSPSTEGRARQATASCAAHQPLWVRVSSIKLCTAEGEGISSRIWMAQPVCSDRVRRRSISETAPSRTRIIPIRPPTLLCTSTAASMSAAVARPLDIRSSPIGLRLIGTVFT